MSRWLCASVLAIGCGHGTPATADLAPPGVGGNALADMALSPDLLPAPDLAHGPDLSPLPVTCPSPQLPDPHAADRASCTFTAGAHATDTLGLSAIQQQHFPITHIVIITQENRSFDHFLGQLASAGQPDADGWPANFTVPDALNQPVAPIHATATTLAADPPHQGDAMSADYDNGKMDGFVRQAAMVNGDGVDPDGCEDEHPTNDIHGGEQWLRMIYESAIASPLWPELAIVLTFDEAGGLPDHVPPPPACPPSPDQSAFNRYGFRVPTILISPYSRPHYVSHVVHDHTSALRLIEVMLDLPALTARDANADALLDMLDLDCPQLMSPAVAANAGGFPFCF
jgi:hypothetical protein